MAAEKRNVRTYKIADKPYRKALKKQKNPPLSTFIEQLVTSLGNGDTITITSHKVNLIKQ
jgi:hypothetical protein